MAGIELIGVSKTYGADANEVHALRNVDLAVAPGELVAVMGASGSGKSTLLTIAGTLEDASEGTVRINGRDVAAMSKNERARLRRQSIGYVFQDLNLLAGLTAIENVALPLELDGVGITDARRAAMEALERMGMDGRADRFPDQLSGGERQRVAVARSVVGQRDVLLADEPTGALDSVNGEGVMRLLARRLPGRRCGNRRHSRRATRLVGRPRGLPPRWPSGRSDHEDAERRLAPCRRRPAVTTQLEEPRTRQNSSGGLPARRAVSRWAWRMFRREWRQQALVLTMLVVAVAATVMGLGLAANAGAGTAAKFGSANVLVTLPGTSPTLSQDIAKLTEKWGTVEVVNHGSIPVPGSVTPVDVRDQAPDGPFLSETMRLDSGSLPTAPDEIAVTDGVLERIRPERWRTMDRRRSHLERRGRRGEPAGPRVRLRGRRAREHHGACHRVGARAGVLARRGPRPRHRRRPGLDPTEGRGSAGRTRRHAARRTRVDLRRFGRSRRLLRDRAAPPSRARPTRRPRRHRQKPAAGFGRQRSHGGRCRCARRSGAGAIGVVPRRSRTGARAQSPDRSR